MKRRDFLIGALGIATVLPLISTTNELPIPTQVIVRKWDKAPVNEKLKRIERLRLRGAQLKGDPEMIEYLKQTFHELADFHEARMKRIVS